MTKPRLKKTAEAIAKITTALAAGHSRDIAAAAAHISKATFQEWVNEDENFAQAVFEAEMEAKRFHLANVHRAAAAGMWTPSAWFLERKYPHEFGKIDRIQAQHIIEIHDLRTQLAQEGIELSDEELLALDKSVNGSQPALPAGKRSRK